MDKTEYLNKRKSLLAQAQNLINDGKIEESKKVMEEIKTLDNGFEASAKAQANLKALNGSGLGGSPFNNSSGKPVGLQDPAIAEDNATDMYATVEYRKAFMDYMMNGTPIPAKFTNASSTTTSSTANTIVPTTTYQKLIVELEKVGAIYARVFKSAYPTALLIPTQSIRPTASWVDEDKGTDSQKLDTDKIVFSGYKLECKVAFSLFMTETALDIFESQFIAQIKDAMVKAIETAIISGTGTGAPKGILNETAAATIEISAKDKLTYDTLLSCEAAVPAAYDDGTVWLMTKKSFFAWLGIKDSSGQPIARVNAGFDGKPSYTLLGREVVFTDGHMENYADTVSSDTTFAMLYRLKDYVFNEVMGLSVKKYVDENTDNTMLKAVMLADGKSVDNHSLIKVVKKATA